MFDQKIYISRRTVLKSALPKGILLFLGNEESPMNFKDNTYHFRQDSSFLYYFGINEPHLAAILDLDEGKTIVFGDEMSMDDIVWMGRQKTLKEKCLESGVEDLQPVNALETYLQQARHQGREIHFLPPYRAENKIRLSFLLKTSIPEISHMVSVPFIKAIVAQRSIKSPEEIKEIHKAAAASADMHLMVMQMATPGMTEAQIAAAIQQAALSGGGQLAYPAILTVRGEILHNHYHGNVLKEGQMVLNDSGVETAMGYAGDLTRTFPVSKKFSAEQKDIYDLVLDAYSQAVDLLSPANKYLDIHYKSCKTLAQGLKDLGLMKGNIDDAVAAGAHALFFQCGTGHMMGLDVHDMEDLGESYVGYTDELIKNTTQFGLKSLRLGRQLEPGFVLTVEPGIYFIPELIDRWASSSLFSEYINYDKVVKYRNFTGIRIEDNFLITEKGYELLGKPLAKTTAEIEEVRERAF